MPLNANFDRFATTQDTSYSGNVLADNGNGPDTGTNLEILKLNGVADSIGQQITLPSGALLTLNRDGAFQYDPNGAFAALGANASSIDSFTYALSDGTTTRGAGVFAAVEELSALDGNNGFAIHDRNANDRFGRSVSSAGDVNGDGIDDLIIGASDADPNSGFSGESYVVFGNSAGFGAQLELSSLDGSNGFVINGIDFSDKSGKTVSSAGDVNGDGIDDLIIGASDADPNGNSSGESYVVFGSSTGWGASLELSALDGSNGFVINGIGAGDYSGKSVSTAGDVNGDGIDDLIIGAHGGDPNGDFSGASYVVFGSKTGFGASLELSALDGSNGFVINGIDANDQSGFSVSSAADVNGDGINDLIIGAPNRNFFYGAVSGESYVVFGNTAGFSANLELSSLDGSNGFVINGINIGDYSGISVASAGDVNSDGIDDLIIGASGSDPNGHSKAGQSYVVFGNGAGFGASLELSSLDGSNGFVINGIDAFDYSGSAVSSAGDVNDDGIDDLIIGAFGRGSRGESYVVFGSSAGFSASLELSTLDGNNGYVIGGVPLGESSGISVSSAGDVNGDGIDDLIVGSYSGLVTGESFVVFGRFGLTPVVDVATVTVTIDGVNDAPTGGVSISGTPVQGGVLNAVSTLADVDGLGPLSYQWARDNVEIAGATDNTYGLIQADVGTKISVRVTYTDQGSTIEEAISGQTDVVADVNDAPVAKDDNVATSAGAVVSGQVLANNGSGADSDLDTGAQLSVFEVNGATMDVGQQITLHSGALLTLNADGTFLYDPNGAFGALGNGASTTDSFTYTLSDGNEALNPGVFAAVEELSALDGSNGFVLRGIDSEDKSGMSVSSAGDVNGDGIDDLIIGAYGADSNSRSSGESYVVFGSRAGFASNLELSALDGSNGFVLNGIDPFDKSGLSASTAGDVNGDGIDDLIIGAYHASSNRYVSGESYVVFGSRAGFASSLNLSALNGSNGFVINGNERGDFSGRSVSSAGDVNGDGIDDLIIGAFGSSPNGTKSGRSFVVFGSNTNFDASLELSALDGSNGFMIDGIDVNDYSGLSVSAAGDVNDDGIDDLIIGASDADPNGNSSGESYVVFGSRAGFATTLELSALDGNNGFVLNGIDADDRSGFSVSSAGDVNGDGIDDLIIGATEADPNGNSSGESYVVFGSSNGFGASLELSVLDGSNGFVINGINANDRAGRSVSSAGDVNGDGIDDLIIGAPGGDPLGKSHAGESYVVFGSRADFDARLELSALDGSNGFVVNGTDVGDYSGRSVSSAGDVNGDGIDDLIIGARDADPNRSSSGESYVVFGRFGLTPVVDMATVTVNITGENDKPTGGISISGLATEGATLTAISTLADADGIGTLRYQWLRDGIAIADEVSKTYMLSEADVGAQISVIASYTDAGGTDESATSARTTVIVPQTEFRGTPKADILVGGAMPETINGLAGNDRIDGGGGPDVLWGGPGDDHLYGDGFQARYSLSEANQVYRVYRVALDREPDHIGHINWTGRLVSGELTLQDVIEGFVNSQEFETNYGALNNQQFVEQLYQNVLGRPGDTIGQVLWESHLNDGGERTDVVQGFAQSSELIAKTIKDANEHSVTSDPAVWSDDVYRLYRAALGREPDALGFGNWSARLSTGTEYEDVISNFVNSPEFQATIGNLNNTQFITLLYNRVLGRAPDEDGLANKVARLDAGGSREVEFVGFTQSTEFSNNAADGLRTWVRGLGVDDRIDGGTGSNVLAGGVLADAFVFERTDAGAHTVIDLEPWDFLSFQEFGYTTAADVRGHLTVSSGNVVFSDQNTEVTFKGTQLNQFEDEIFLL